MFLLQNKSQGYLGEIAMAEFRTLKSWNKCGRRIKAGSKAKGRTIKGVALFTKSQTYESEFFDDIYAEDDSWGDRQEDNYVFGSGGNPDEMDFDMGLIQG